MRLLFEDPQLTFFVLIYFSVQSDTRVLVCRDILTGLYPGPIPLINIGRSSSVSCVQQNLLRYNLISTREGPTVDTR